MSGDVIGEVVAVEDSLADSLTGKDVLHAGDGWAGTLIADVVFMTVAGLE